MKKIGISFKDTEKVLYNYLKEQLSPSIFIKQLLIEQMKKEDKSKDNNIKNNFKF